MNYLLINHVPFSIGSSPATVRTSPEMLTDLRAQSEALAAVGLRLIVAAPVVPARHPAARKCGSLEFAPDDAGFELFHLPVYASMRDYWRVKSRLVEALRRIIPAGRVVQMGYGGHPMMLGEVAWPIAGLYGVRRVWMFDAVDPFPAMRREAKRDRNAIKRVLKNRLTEHKLRFCRKAITQADLVFTHNAAVAGRFARVWHDGCQVLDAPLLEASDVLTDRQARQRAAGSSDKKQPLRLLCFGPHSAGDRADHLIRAVAHCRRLSVPVKLRYAGPRDEGGKLAKLAAELAMGEYFEAVEMPVSGLGDMIDATDAVIAVRSDGWHDRPTLLAFARGRPVVAYENAATDRLIESADAGVVVPGQNVLLLAQAMIDLHVRRQRLLRLAENARTLALSRTREAVHSRRAQLVAELLAATANEHAA